MSGNDSYDATHGESDESAQRRLKARLFRGDPILEDALNNRRTIRRGSRGGPVSKIQRALVELGHPLPKFGVDGQFGSETERAITSFQRQQAIGVDGVVGPVTMGRLDDAMFARERPGVLPPVEPPVVPPPPSGFVPQVTSAVFRPMQNGDGAVEVFVAGSGFLTRAAPVVATLGDQSVDFVVVQSDGGSFGGQVAERPREGSMLSVGYADTELVPTGIVYASQGTGGDDPLIA